MTKCKLCADKIARYKKRIKKLKLINEDLDADNYDWSMQLGRLKQSIDQQIKTQLDYYIHNLPDWHQQEKDYWREYAGKLEKQLNEMQRKYE